MNSIYSGWRIYFVDNMVIPVMSDENGGNEEKHIKTCQRINQYDTELVNKMIASARRRRSGKIVFDKFHVSTKNLAKFYSCEEVWFS